MSQRRRGVWEIYEDSKMGSIEMFTFEHFLEMDDI